MTNYTCLHYDCLCQGSDYIRVSYHPVTHVAELVIAEASAEDAGIYLCKAESEAGYAEISCSVKVQGL